MKERRGDASPLDAARQGAGSPLDEGFGPLPPETLKALAASSIAGAFRRTRC
jgi:hypothetical protein